MSLTLNMVGGGGEEYRRLPREYQEVEYLQSSGTQGFSTGYNLVSETEILIDFMWTSLRGDSDVMGAEGGSNGFGIILNEYTTSGKPQNCNRMLIRGSGTSNVFYSPFSYVTNTKYTATLETSTQANGTHVFINSTQWGYVASVPSTNYPLGMFCRNNSGNLSSFCSCRIYSCKIKNNGILVRDFVPCYRKADSVAGMYDVTNDVFYTNQGSGSFVVGGDVK